MNKQRLVRNTTGLVGQLLRNPLGWAKSELLLEPFLRASRFASSWDTGRAASTSGPAEAVVEPNPLREYCESITSGPGVVKYVHYFDLYHRHLAKFIGKPVHLVEVGVYSGGSLGMWRSYLGPNSLISGVDIVPACKAYENEYTRIHIGDQADRSFWKKFLDESPPVDILIDDGGHLGHQMITTLEEVLPRMNPGGVFICEDVHSCGNEFAAYASGLEDALDAELPQMSGEGIRLPTTPFQSEIHSIHRYPQVVVIEKHDRPVPYRELLRRGTEWQPDPN